MREYPYLGKMTLDNDESYVVFFTEKDFGVIVQSDVTSNPRLTVGAVNYDFDEERFEYLDPEVMVRLNNA